MYQVIPISAYDYSPIHPTVYPLICSICITHLFRKTQEITKYLIQLNYMY